jgi:8-oxo-dGTP diphosphatase
MALSRDSEEQAFLAGYDASLYPRPSVAVDVVLLTVAADGLRALLLRRVEQPALGLWTNPGGFVHIEESLDDAAIRILADKVGLEGVFLEQLYTFGDPGRDPRTRVISVGYYALVDAARLEATLAGRHGPNLRLARVEVDDDTGTATATDGDGTPLSFAFDHERILATAVARIRGKVTYAPIGFELLPETFTLRDLRLVYEAILGRTLNKDSFRRTVQTRGLVEPTGKLLTGLGHRPAELYRFAPTPEPVQ